MACGANVSDSGPLAPHNAGARAALWARPQYPTGLRKGPNGPQKRGNLHRASPQAAGYVFTIQWRTRITLKVWSRSQKHVIGQTLLED